MSNFKSAYSQEQFNDDVWRHKMTIMSDEYPEKIVTERDFRRPEFKNADPKDYEFRDDGEIVRKDRWQVAIQNISSRVLSPRKEFEISDVVRAACGMADFVREGWIGFGSPLRTQAQQFHQFFGEPGDIDPDLVIDVLMDNGSIIVGLKYRSTDSDLGVVVVSGRIGAEQEISFTPKAFRQSGAINPLCLNEEKV